MKNIFKNYMLPIIIPLLLGISGGIIFNTINQIKDNSNNLETDSIYSNIYVSSISYCIENKNSQPIEKVADCIFDNHLDINLYIENETKNPDLCYTVLVLVDSKPINLYTNKETYEKYLTINPNKNGTNVFKLITSNINSIPQEISLVLFGSSGNNYCINISDQKEILENYPLLDTGEDNFGSGLYINYKYSNQRIKSSDLILLDKQNNVDIPFILKPKHDKEDLKLYLFDNNYNIIPINGQGFLHIICNNKNINQGIINIQNIEKKENTYMLVAIPTENNSHNYYFSNNLKVIGE